MEENTYKFDLPAHHKSIIKVIGVGGGGSNAVNHMFNQGIKDVEFIVCNTDLQALHGSPVPNRLQIGMNLTGGLGAGANPEKGKNAALESKEDIREMLQEDTRMVFVTAGMGGGTGTGAAPVIAKVAHEMEILTVGIVTMPFAFEGKKKMTQADMGLRELRECCDTVLVILNDKLREVYGNLSISTAFAQADNVLTTAAKGIAEIITVPGYVNVDFEDVKTVMVKSGAAVMGTAQTEGENRALRAAEEAISSPLLNNRNIHGANKILLSIISGEEAELQMDELSEITEFIQQIAGEEAEVIFGHGVDQSLEQSIRVTVIATGFGETSEVEDREDYRKVFDLESTPQIGLFGSNQGEPDKPVVPESPEMEEMELERPYSFEPPEPIPVEEKDDSREFSEIDQDYDLGEDKPIEAEPQPETEAPRVVDFNDKDLSSKKVELQRQAEDRVKKLQGLKTQPVNSDDFKEKLEVPAYLRQKVRLQDVPHSSENDISRYNLNDENQILGNNKFLHDNVD